MNTPDVLVTGAGVFGAWIAWKLLRSGAKVQLVDAWAPGHSRASSGGESRIIRMGYGADEIYTRMAMRSLPQWREIAEATGEPLFHRTGVLWIGRAGDAYSEATLATLERVGVAIEKLSHEEMARRFPQMQLTDAGTFGVLEVDSGALMARRAIAALVRDFVDRGGRFSCSGIKASSARGILSAVETANEERISAGLFVFACGPWLPKLFPDLLGKRIFPTRQEVFFFAPSAGDVRFSPPQLPVWIDFTDARGPYGFPDLEARGVKLAFDRHGDPFDPDSGDRTISPAAEKEARAFIGERFPALANSTLTEFRVCQYENTSSGDFLIDRHPELDNVWLVGGGSGHGFKHGPGVADYLCARMLAGAAAEPRFSLATKAEAQSRTVF